MHGLISHHSTCLDLKLCFMVFASSVSWWEIEVSYRYYVIDWQEEKSIELLLCFYEWANWPSFDSFFVYVCVCRVFR